MEAISSPAAAEEPDGTVLTDEWLAEHFDHLAPELGEQFEPTMERMRSLCPVAHSDQHGGFWVVNGYHDVLSVLQDWHSFSNAQGVSIPMALSNPPLPPDEFDPPIHRVYRRLINTHLTPAVIATYEEPTRRMIDRLIDAFIEEGRCEWMEDFASQLPRRSFFEFVFHAPDDDLDQLNEWTRIISTQRSTTDYLAVVDKLTAWIEEFANQRRRQPPRGDIVDEVVNAKINGRPITRDEMVGTLQELMNGGFDTTAAALGHVMIRLARDPALPARLAANPDLIPRAIEEFLRIDPPVICMARSVVRDTEIGGKQFRAGDKVLFSLASANRDGTEFDQPQELNIDRVTNRHLTFGAGPHRCAGSSLARMNLRLALEAVVSRMHHIRLRDGAEPIRYVSAFTRSPVAVPITFTAGAKSDEFPTAVPSE